MVLGAIFVFEKTRICLAWIPAVAINSRGLFGEVSLVRGTAWTTCVSGPEQNMFELHGSKIWARPLISVVGDSTLVNWQNLCGIGSEGVT